MVRIMSKTTMTIKIDKDLKRRAQATAAQIGIPLSTIVNAYLKEMSDTGRVQFKASEPMTPQMEKIIEEAEREIAAGEISGPFHTSEEWEKHLDSL